RPSLAGQCLERKHESMAWFETANLRVDKSSEGGAILSLDVADRNVNVFNPQVLADLENAVDRLGEDRSLKLLGIRSASATKPIAGADIQAFANIKGPEDASALSALGQRVFEKLADLPVPTFIVIQGPCLGGGLEFALACDYRLAVDDAKTQLGFPEVEL